MSEQVNQLSFSTKLKELPVLIDEKNYKLVELSGERRSDYNQKSLDRMEIKGREIVKMKDMKGVEMDILEYSLYDPQNKLVGREELQTWPHPVLEALAKASMDLSGILIPGEKKPKNESGAKSSTGSNSQPE